MYSHINKWLEWFGGNVKGFHSYQYYTGNEYIDLERYTLGMPKKLWIYVKFLDTFFRTNSSHLLLFQFPFD